MKLLISIILFALITFPTSVKAESTRYTTYPTFQHTVIKEYWDNRYKKRLQRDKSHQLKKARHNEKRKERIFLIREGWKPSTVVRIKQIK